MIHNPILTKILDDFGLETQGERQVSSKQSESFIIKAFEAGEKEGIRDGENQEKFERRGYLSAIQDMEKKVPTYDDISESFLETHSGDWVRNEVLSTLKELKEKV